MADPFTPGGRLYRTGDVVKRRPDGLISFLGRADDQVKVRGYRIEPAEIQAALLSHPAISGAVIVADGERLIAYVVAEGGVPSVTQLRGFLGERLPEFMIPAVFVELAAIPLTGNGKVDRSALPAPDQSRPELEDAFVAPQTPAQEVLAGIWGDVLGVDRVGILDNFFELGGHSLLATQVVSRIRAAFGVELPVAALFDAPSVALLAGVIGDAAPGAAAPSIVAVDRGRKLPLSFAQQRLWFLAQLEPESSEYNTPLAITLAGEVDAERLAGALGALVARHEVLRTRLVGDDDGVPWQVVDPPTPFVLPVVDLSGGDDPLAAAREWLDADRRVPFDLAAGPLFRATLLRVAADEHVLAIAKHHAVSDEWSTGILRRELEAFYAGDGELPALPVQYADFAVWQRQWLTGAVLDGQVAYWSDRLAGAPTLELPTDRVRPAQRSSAGAVLPFVVPAEVAEGLRAVARGAGASMFMTVLAAFNVLLGRYSGQDDIIVGTPVANRNRAEIEGLIGIFVNTLVLRTDLSGDPTFGELLGRVRSATLGAYAHQDLPFEQLVDELGVERDRSRTPLFQVLFTYVTGGGEPGPAEPDGPRSVPVRFDLSMTVAEAGPSIECSLQYSTALYDHGTISRLIAHFQGVLAAVAADAGCRVSQVSLETSAWGDGGLAAPWSGSVVDLIAARVAETPDAVAVVAGDVSLSYADLWRRSGALAGRLDPESVVALRLGRGVEFVVAALGVWRAGGAYLPLDPELPEERLAYILADSGAVPLLEAPCVPAAIRPGQAAYVMYTSGSTGRPKGVVVSHGNLVSFLAAMAERPGLSAEDVVLAVTTFGFDIAGLELWLPLVVGGRVVIADEVATRSPRLLAGLLESVSVVQATPATWQMLVEDGWTGSGRLRVLCGGEALPESLAGALVERAGSVWNMYGPTETTIWSAVDEVTAGERITLGSPIAGTCWYVLDRSLHQVPTGAVGELFIGGAGVARGYLGRPELTAERFVAGPAGSRLYRTGDLVRWSVDGRPEFVGRADFQVKVRGFRIELGEVEAVLREAGASAAVVTVDAGSRLIAYVVGVVDVGLVRERLPQYMVPGVFVELTALPLNANGKVDRRALPAVDVVAGAEFVAPRTPVEEAIAAIWADVLGAERVGVEDNFFVLGGHSLLATRVVSRIRAALGVEIPVAAVFDAPTVAGLAAVAEAVAPGVAVPAVVPVDRRQRLPLSFGQQRLWFLAQLEPESVEYHTPITIGLGGPLDVDALAAALDGLVARHEVLRTRLVADDDGVPWQVIDPPAPIPLPIVAIAADEVEAWLAADAAAPFDLAAGPLFRAALLRITADDHVLALAMHHIVSDEWSAEILRRELAALYAGEELTALPVQYADFAVWQRQRLTGAVLDGQVAYWSDRLAGAPTLELPTDRPRPPIRSSDGAIIRFAIPDDVAARLRALSVRSGASMFMTAFAVYTVLLARYSGQDDIVVGTPIASRSRAEVEGLIGYFVNTLALRTDLSGDPTFGELLDRVRTETLQAFAHQDVPFERLVDELVRERDRSRTPLFQVLFSYFTDADGPAPVGEVRRAAAKFDLRLVLAEHGQGLIGAVHYATRLFDEATIRRFIQHFLQLLTSVTADPGTPLSRVELHAGSWPKASVVPLPDVTGVEALIDAEVVVCDGDPVPFARIEARANRLAHHLRSAGVGPESVVGLAVERGDDFVAAVLAVWRAGGAYVTLDPDGPVQRSAWQITEAGVSVLLGTADRLGDLPILRRRVVRLDDPQLDNLPETPPDVRGLAQDRLAYVMFTSGSTGRPKAVQVTHRALLNYITAVPERLGLGVRGASYALVQPPTTDGGNTVLFTALTTGGRLHFADPAAIAGYLAEHHVDYLKLVPSHLAGLADGGDLARLLPARGLVLGGEAIPIGLARELVEVAGDRTVANLYGPTETTIGVATARLSPAVLDDVVVPIGEPLPNVRLYVLDRSLREVPVGVHGELYVGGAALARGYRGGPELTAERFVADPFAAGGRLYRTGDVVKRRPDGLIAFLGRTDDQVKVRGHRIEPAEIQAAVLAHPAVSAAVIVAVGGRLVAYLVAEEAPSAVQLRAFLGERLPEYMVPSVFVALAAIPLTANGKVNRSALPAPDQARPELEDAFVAPQTPAQEVLAGIWAELLELDRVGVRDNFFQLGGHSLLATRVVSRVRAAFGVELPVAALFDAPTVAGLAEAIAAAAPGLAAPPIRPADRGGPLPLSFAQQRLWFLAQLDPASAEYNLALRIGLGGDLDAPALAGALTALTERHEVLRTRLVADADGVPWQVIDPPAPIDLRTVDIAAEEVAAWLAADALVPFDLAAEPPFRATLLRVAADRHLLAIAMHHVAGDEWSGEILRRELAALYAGSELPALPVQYADFAVWQRQWLTGEVLDAQVLYWSEHLAGAATLELPADRPRPAQRSSAGAMLRFSVPADVTAGLRALSRSSGASMFMTVFAAFSVLLGRYSGQDDIVVGTPIANRNRAEVEGLIGFFVNTLVLRTDLSGDPMFGELLGRVRSATLGAYEHQDVPFEQLVDELGVERDRSRTPLFQVLFNYLTAGGEDRPVGERSSAVAVKVDLSVALTDGPSGLSGAVQYSTALFDEARIERLIGHFGQVLAAVASDPACRVSQVPVLTSDESAAVQAWSAPGGSALSASSVLDLIPSSSDALAVRCGDTALTYADLWDRSGRVAAWLLDAGISAESVVGLRLGRGVEFVVAALAVWRAGAAYLPLDPTYPADRLEFMIADSGAALVLDALPDAQTSSDLPTIRGDQAAYVIYTSGSTGRPKGVVVSHRGVVNLAEQMGPLLGAERVVLQFASFSFDAAVFDLAVVLAAGGTLVIASAEERSDPRALTQLINEAGVVAASVVPSLLSQLDPADVPGMDTWVLGAELLTEQLAARWSSDFRVVNTYGPTEATVMSTAGPGVTIGAPLANVRVHVLDRFLNPVPVGVTGEAYIGGVGVARGYAGRADLTAERFVADPFAADGSRLYRSGDVVRWNADGRLEFVGRADRQVKLRGFRIELGEVEAVLREAGASEAVVVVDGQRLVAYVVGAADTELVSRKLPEYMVPSVYVELPVLPLNPNGKIDRSALPKPESTTVFAAAASPVQEVLAAIWAELLGVDRVGVHDNFFVLGGHSLLATQVVSRIRAVFGVEVPVAAVFDAPTVAQLAAVVEGSSSEVTAPPIVGVGRTDRLPLSFAQQRLWFLAQLQPASTEYNMPATIGLRGDVDTAALAAALGGLVARHEVLRTRLVADDDGVPWQVIDPPGPFELPVVDVAADAVEAWLAADAAVPFDLATGPLLRATLLRVAEDEHLLALAMHHVVGDEWSAGVLRRELEALYAAEDLPALPVQYADFAVWQRQWLTGEVLEDQLGYWTEHLADLPVLELPTDRPRPPVRSSDGAMIEFAIPDEVAQRLRALSRRSGASMFMTMFALYTMLLSRYSGQDDIVVGTPIANRNRAEVEGLIGYFVNTLVLRADLSGDPTFGELLARVRAETLQAFAHQDVPFEQLVNELVHDRDRSRTPLFQVLFNYFAGGGEQGPSEEVQHRLTKFDLRLIVRDRGAGLLGSVHYATRLFDESTIRRLIAHFLELVSAVAEEVRLSELPLSAGSWHEAPPLELPAVSGVDALIDYPDPRVNQLANYLRSVGVGPESVVGLAVESGDDFVRAVLAVWRAGGAYVTLDPSLPVQRSKFQLA
ncbi:amino acid adenylation domain-containing protein, partial [Dactylosporangium sp. NPDC051541]|uniref:amino acid adenylation domain-containing protein n=1 Tax=Dactylosporangium sp. NPDC051541 TaxID=3363977 RepID=UPI0037A87F00